MSKINISPVWYPPQFPAGGRLPRHEGQVFLSQRRQVQQATAYHDALCIAAAKRVTRPFCKTLHITLCFDGTGNNLNNDLLGSKIPHPTNIARLFRASIGAGHAGGTGHGGNRASTLLDADGVGRGQFFKYYMPGVGTPFAEVGDLDYTVKGLALGFFGEERINWALMMIIDALRRTMDQPRLSNAQLLAAVKNMGARLYLGEDGSQARAREFSKQLAAIEHPLHIALTQPHAGAPKLLGIKLYVYGFSRGAASARAFVNWLNGLLVTTDSTPSLKVNDLELPLDVEYLGLFDTVASVGIADFMPGADGHMGWADASQALPRSALVKRCLHIVASHEQRVCFPLESIRREDGTYPDNCVEVVYPGVHSDQGGGYPPGDQGKAIGSGDSALLSQIALHDVYADALSHGAPLKVPRETLPDSTRNELWRAMEFDVVESFRTSTLLVTHFNAWREVTLDLKPSSEPLPLEEAERYRPIPSTQQLEEAVRNQLAWITAWRIDRYAFSTLKDTSFYANASDEHRDHEKREAAQEQHANAEARIKKNRALQLAMERNTRRPSSPLEPGVPDFDPDLAQTQLRDAALEFRIAYRQRPSTYNPMGRLGVIGALNPAYKGVLLVYRILTATTRTEQLAVKASGRAKVGVMFPPPPDQWNHINEIIRGNVDEASNARKPAGLLRALFDDQVHDSRAWFLYSLGREPGGSYFDERMVFFGEANRRELALRVEAVAKVLAKDPRILNAAKAQQVVRPMTQEQRVQAIQRVDDIFNAFYASQTEEGADAQI